MFNSAMAYELCILKPIVEPLLFSITEDDPEYQEAKRLLKFLAYFLPCQADNVPINSIMREFIGGDVLGFRKIIANVYTNACIVWRKIL